MRIYKLFFLLVMPLFFYSCNDTKEYKIKAYQGGRYGKYFSELLYDTYLVTAGNNIYFVEGSETDTAYVVKRESFNGGVRFQIIDKNNDAYILIIDDAAKKIYIREFKGNFTATCEIE